jgi:hypothetical protein
MNKRKVLVIAIFMNWLRLMVRFRAMIPQREAPRAKFFSQSYLVSYSSNSVRIIRLDSG